MQAAAEPKIIGVLGMGAMGAGVAGDLRASGFRVLSVLSGRSERSRQRAERAGIEPMPDLAALLAQCDTFLSIVPADQAEPLAEAVAGSLGGRPIHYVDCNSITPSKAARIARRLEAAGATYSDGGIIGPPPGGKVKTRLYVSGPSSGVLQSFQSERMPVFRLGDGLTQATEMKVLFSAANKGAMALLANVLAAARGAGLLERVVGELDGVRPGLLTCVRSAAPELDEKAARWAIEMDDLAAGLEEMGAHGGYHVAAGESYRRLAANLGSAPSTEEPLQRVLTAWTGPKTA
ncbi:MAG: NAD(P)-binding domain-containing protein [Hyphomicrobiaceae bacterium]